jgi:hypothetical protein
MRPLLCHLIATDSHPLFLRSEPSLCTQIKRDRAPGTALQQAMAAKAAIAKNSKGEANCTATGACLSNRKAKASTNEKVHKSKAKGKPKTKTATYSNNTQNKKMAPTGSKKKKNHPKKTPIARNPKANTKDTTPQVSPTGIDTSLFERQVYTFDDDGTGLGGIPETLLDPLNCFQTNEIQSTAYSLTRRREALNSKHNDDLEDRFGMGFFNLAPSSDDIKTDKSGLRDCADHLSHAATASAPSYNHGIDKGLDVCGSEDDDSGSIFTISDVPVDDSPTIDDINDDSLNNNLSELVSEVVDDAVSSVAPPSSNESHSHSDPHSHSHSNGLAQEINVGSDPQNPSTTRYDNDDAHRHPHLHSTMYHPHHHQHHHHYGHYSFSYAGTAASGNLVPQYPNYHRHHHNHGSPSLPPVVHPHPPNHHHRPLYYPHSLPTGMYHHV